MDETEMEVAQILLQLPRLVHESGIRSMFPFSWASKKHRTIRKFTALSRREIPLSFTNLKIRIPLKRKRSEDNHQNPSLRSAGKKERSGMCAVKDESAKGKEVIESSSSHALLLPDLNIPLLEEDEEEEDDCHGNR